MSYINEALKKAQELKDSGCAKYNNIPVSVNAGGRRFRIKIFLYSISVAVAVLFVILGYGWLNSSQEKRGSIAPSPDRGALNEKDAGLDKKQLYDKALSLYKAGRIPEAKKIYEAVVALDPGYIEALNNLGIINIHDKNFSAAKENLEKAVRLNPSYVESYYNLACLYAIKGDAGQGLEYLKKAISLNSNVKDWARDDSDLNSLKGSDEFRRMVSQ